MPKIPQVVSNFEMVEGGWFAIPFLKRQGRFPVESDPEKQRMYNVLIFL